MSSGDVLALVPTPQPAEEEVAMTQAVLQLAIMLNPVGGPLPHYNVVCPSSHSPLIERRVGGGERRKRGRV